MVVCYGVTLAALGSCVVVFSCLPFLVSGSSLRSEFRKQINRTKNLVKYALMADGLRFLVPRFCLAPFSSSSLHISISSLVDVDDSDDADGDGPFHVAPHCR